MKKNIIILLAIVLTVTACERDVNVNIPYEGDKLVLNTFMKADSLIYVQVSKTKKLSQNYNPSVPSGTSVQLYKNGNFAENLILKTINNQEYFTSVSKATIGDTYTIKANATSLTAVEGTDFIPLKPNVTPISFLANSVNNPNAYNSKIKLKLNDPVANKNYYLLKVFSADTNMSPTGPRFIINRGFGQIFSADIVGANATADIFGNSGNNMNVFADDQFNGKEITINIEADAFGSGNVLYLAVSLTALTADAYKYLVSTEAQFNTQGNPFAEVAVVYNNIKNGYGIVAGTADSIMVVRRQ